MKRLIVVLSLLPLFVLLVLPAAASDGEDLLQRQEKAAGVDELERAAKQNGGLVDYGVELNEGLSVLLETGSGEIKGIFKRALRSAVMILCILMLCGVADTVQGAFGRTGTPVVRLTGALAITAITAVDVNALIGLGRGAIDGMRSFADVLLPVMAAVTAATGAVTGAAMRRMAAVLFCDLLINLIDRLLIPILYGYIALSAAHTATGNEGLKRMSALFKWICTTVLAITMLAFVSYLSLSGVVSGSADAAAIKTAKFAISNAIPVVGGILSDAAETVLASAGILRGSVGIFGAVTVLGLCLLPLLRMAVHYLIYKLVAALASSIGSDQVSGLVDRIGGAFGLLMGMTGACCLLLLISVVSSVSVAAI